MAKFILAGKLELPHVPDNETIADEVRKCRGKRKLSQDVAAEQIGISHRYLAQIEQHRSTNMSLDVYRAIVDWMGA